MNNHQSLLPVRDVINLAQWWFRSQQAAEIRHLRSSREPIAQEELSRLQRQELNPNVRIRS